MADPQLRVKDVKERLNEASYVSSAFFVTRYPYACAVLLMLTTGEAVKSSVRVSEHKMNMAYAHLGIYFLSGTAMAFNIFGTKRLFALLSAVQIGFESYECYASGDRKEAALVVYLSF